MVEHSTADREVTGSNPVAPFFSFDRFFFLVSFLLPYDSFFLSLFPFSRLFIIHMCLLGGGGGGLTMLPALFGILDFWHCKQVQ